MTEELNKLYQKEFKEMIQYRQQYMANNRNFAVENLPIPATIQNAAGIHNHGNKVQTYAVLKGIEEPYFDKLNGSIVTVYPENVNISRPRLDSNGELMRDDSGAIMLTQITVPKGSIVIASTVNIQLPNYTADRQLYKIKDTHYKYATCIKTKTGAQQEQKTYLYVVPKTVVYKLNTVSLVLSARPRRNFAQYKSLRVLLQNGAYVYITVMPTDKITNTTDMVVCCTKMQVDFSVEIRNLLACWAQTVACKQPDGRTYHYIFKAQDTVVDIDGVRTNLAIKDLTSVNNALDSDLYVAESMYSMGVDAAGESDVADVAE